MVKEGEEPKGEPWCVTHGNASGGCGKWMGGKDSPDDDKKCIIVPHRPKEEKTGTMPESPDSIKAKLFPILGRFGVPPSQRPKMAEEIINALLPEDKQDPNTKPGFRASPLPEDGLREKEKDVLSQSKL